MRSARVRALLNRTKAGCSSGRPDATHDGTQARLSATSDIGARTVAALKAEVHNLDHEIEREQASLRAASTGHSVDALTVQTLRDRVADLTSSLQAEQAARLAMEEQFTGIITQQELTIKTLENRCAQCLFVLPALPLHERAACPSAVRVHELTAKLDTARARPEPRRFDSNEMLGETALGTGLLGTLPAARLSPSMRNRAPSREAALDELAR